MTPQQVADEMQASLAWAEDWLETVATTRAHVVSGRTGDTELAGRTGARHMGQWVKLLIERSERAA